eukprot:CAMPEP_0173191348 /NCGR_PEP_ID=MMETSP1141-20130122/12833_1 /TAXON_ID=483371 /ORGANISM="non described non described, Strain CCMP2298" /LENGTH=123 /DNA_ID=CAMNT_0014115523 /DNA_START=31 /DNA_END=402 /DNA_ORIENTATION=+
MQFFYLISLLTIGLVAAFMPTGSMMGRSLKLNMQMKFAGKVKFFDTVKGFGFITPDEGGDDVFVHQSAILAQGFRSLAEGEVVEYDISEDPNKGKKFASNVTGPNGAYVQGAPRRDPRDDMRY